MSDLKYNFDDNLNLLRVASSDLSVLRERLASEFSGFEGVVANPHLLLSQIAALQGRMEELSSSAASLLASRTSLVSSSLSSSLSLSVAVSSLCRELKLDDSEGVVEGKNKGKASGGGVNNAFPKHLIETEGDENEEPRKFGAMGATELQGVAELELKLWKKSSQ